jgi:AcrR family transcriptional regulator
VDAAIVDATLRLLADGGYAALTMEAVAALAGVGKATLYRRYTGKEQLVVDAVATLSETPEVVEGAGVRDELVARLEAVRRKSDSSLAGQIFPQLISAAADHPELMRSYRRQVLAPRRAAFAATLHRGVAQGLVRADVDVDHAIDMLVGPMAYRNLIRNDPPPGPELAARIVDLVLTALAPGAGGSGGAAAATRPDPRTAAPEDRT